MVVTLANQYMNIVCISNYNTYNHKLYVPDIAKNKMPLLNLNSSLLETNCLPVTPVQLYVDVFLQVLH